jgi:hypothetical protein
MRLIRLDLERTAVSRRLKIASCTERLVARAGKDYRAKVRGIHGPEFSS